LLVKNKLLALLSINSPVDNNVASTNINSSLGTQNGLDYEWFSRSDTELILNIFVVFAWDWRWFGISISYGPFLTTSSVLRGSNHLTTF